MFRAITATLAALAILTGTAGSADAFGIELALDTSACGTLTITATGLTPNTAYQLVADGGSPDVVHAVTADANGRAQTTITRSEASADSSADWGNASARTQYGGYLATNVREITTTDDEDETVVVAYPSPPAYHFVACR